MIQLQSRKQVFYFLMEGSHFKPARARGIDALGAVKANESLQMIFWRFSKQTRISKCDCFMSIEKLSEVEGNKFFDVIKSLFSRMWNESLNANIAMFLAWDEDEKMLLCWLCRTIVILSLCSSQFSVLSSQNKKHKLWNILNEMIVC